MLRKPAGARRILGPFYLTGVFWFWFHRLGVRVIPEWALGSIRHFFTSLFFLTLRNIRATIAENLSRSSGLRLGGEAAAHLPHPPDLRLVPPSATSG